jgi:hypothetical protein
VSFIGNSSLPTTLEGQSNLKGLRREKEVALMRRSILLVTVALITAAMFAVGSPSAFAQGAEVSDVTCDVTTSAGNQRLEGQEVITPTGDAHRVCHGDASRTRNESAETFEQPCPTGAGETTGSGVLAPSGETTFVCHGNGDVGGLPNE